MVKHYVQFYIVLKSYKILDLSTVQTHPYTVCRFKTSLSCFIYFLGNIFFYRTKYVFRQPFNSINFPGSLSEASYPEDIDMGLTHLPEEKRDKKGMYSPPPSPTPTLPGF